jgi:hypothetical protein
MATANLPKRHVMNQSLTLPGDVYRKLAQAAAEHRMTIESFLTCISELVVVPNQPTPHDLEKCERIEGLLQRLRTGELGAEDRGELDRLVHEDYQAANARADQLIRAKQRRTRNGHAPERKRNGSAGSSKRSQK